MNLAVGALRHVHGDLLDGGGVWVRERDTGDAAYLHLMAVTGMDETQAYRHVQGAFGLWQERSAQTWELDLSMLTDAGVTHQRPPSAKERPAAAQEAFAAQDDGIRHRATERAKAEGIRLRALNPSTTAVAETSSAPQEPPVDGPKAGAEPAVRTTSRLARWIARKRRS